MACDRPLNKMSQHSLPVMPTKKMSTQVHMEYIPAHGVMDADAAELRGRQHAGELAYHHCMGCSHCIVQMSATQALFLCFCLQVMVQFCLEAMAPQRPSHLYGEVLSMTA